MRHNNFFGAAGFGPRKFSLIALILVTLVFQSAVRAANVEYGYDENGRLVTVIAANGESAQYVYDVAGNIVEIKRFTAGTFALMDFSPKRGGVGTPVTIWGSGFSSVPSQNTVTFNAAAATVTSASPNKLIAVVPTGSTTGAIAVTVSSATRTSSKPFVVTSSMNCPSLITGFTPNVGTAGTSVTITGAELDYGAVSDKVIQFNRNVGSVQSATASSLVGTVPSGATSGRLSVSVPPTCSAINAGDFFVPPTPFVASDIGATGRVSINGATLPVTLASGKKGLIIFDGAINTGVTLYLTSSTFSSVIVEMRDPTGVLVFPAGTTSVSSAQGESLPFLLGMNGTYSIFVKPASGAAGSVTLQVASPDLSIGTATVGTITENRDGSYNIPVAFTVTNVGGATAGNSWWDHIFISANGFLDASTVSAASIAGTTPLGPGNFYTVNQTLFNVTGFVPGNYTLFVKTDASTQAGMALDNGVKVETDETNNVTPGVSITLPPYPDLSISNASVGSITKHSNGTYSIPVSFTVTNVGSTPAQGGWWDYAFISSNGVLEDTTPIAGTAFHATTLAGSANYGVNQTFVITAMPGSYKIFLKTDGEGPATGNGAVKETSETNNKAAGISITLP